MNTCENPLHMERVTKLDTSEAVSWVNIGEVEYSQSHSFPGVEYSTNGVYFRTR
jgi:hypothetical protein